MAVVQYAKNICGMEQETEEYEKKAKRLSVLQKLERKGGPYRAP
jgi:hypothetical protein